MGHLKHLFVISVFIFYLNLISYSIFLFRDLVFLFFNFFSFTFCFSFLPSFMHLSFSSFIIIFSFHSFTFFVTSSIIFRYRFHSFSPYFVYFFARLFSRHSQAISIFHLDFYLFIFFCSVGWGRGRLYRLPSARHLFRQSLRLKSSPCFPCTNK